MSEPAKVFITYSHKDAEKKQELETHLEVMKQNGEIDLWNDNEILPGDAWRETISTSLGNSDMLLYLASAQSLASENCNRELAEALKENTRVVPIILEACDWKRYGLAKSEALPDKGKPLNEWQPESKGWQNIVDGIRKAIMPSQAPQEEMKANLARQQGDFLLMLGQTDLAIQSYAVAIRLNSDNADAWYNRGSAYNEYG